MDFGSVDYFFSATGAAPRKCRSRHLKILTIRSMRPLSQLAEYLRSAELAVGRNAA